MGNPPTLLGVGNPFPTLLDTSHGQEIPPWVAPVGGKSLSHPS